jgi:hypothetical protein
MQWARAVAVTQKRCTTATETYPSAIDANYSILNAEAANNAMKCAQRLRGTDQAYVLLYALDVFATVEYGRDLAGLHRDNNLRQERLIDSALKMPGLPGVLRRALLDVKRDLLNYDALND